MKTILFLILLFPVLSFSQERKTVEIWNESYITMDMISSFYMNPKTSYSTPRRRLGYIKNISEKSKIGVSLGFGNRATSLTKTGDNYLLWEVRPEFYHIIKSKEKSNIYFALELFYIYHNEEFTTQSFLSTQKEYLRFDKADYNRQKFGFIPKLGVFINLSKRMGMNVYTGLGLKYRINAYSNFINLREIPFEEEHFTPYYRKEGNKLGIEFSLGLKLYYRIKK